MFCSNFYDFVGTLLMFFIYLSFFFFVKILAFFIEIICWKAFLVAPSYFWIISFTLFFFFKYLLKTFYSKVYFVSSSTDCHGKMEVAHNFLLELVENFNRKIFILGVFLLHLWIWNALKVTIMLYLKRIFQCFLIGTVSEAKIFWIDSTPATGIYF